MVDTGLTNAWRGKALRQAVNLYRCMEGEGPPPVHQECWVCGDIFDQLERFASSAIHALSPLEFNNYLIGTRIDPVIQSNEERLWDEVGGEQAEPIKGELNREIGKIVGEEMGKEVEFESPEVVAIVDTRFAHVVLDISPLFIYGRYRKLSREIPQSTWPCNRCRGKGCERCDHTGKMYQTSVQELIGDLAMDVTQGEEHLFHGMGREDVDALMLGTGRPFVLEIRNPKRRFIDLEKLEKKVNERASGKAEFLGLRMSSRDEVREVKMANPSKVYRVEVGLEGKIDKEKLNEVVRSLKGTIIVQHTPTRVAHRRADKARRRKIIDIWVDEICADGIVLYMEAEAGTYVKEFIHGDNERTRPNLSEALGVKCEVSSLDVIGVTYDDNEE